MSNKELVENLKRQYRTRDRVSRVISEDGLFRAVAVRNTNTAIEAQKRHNLGYMPAYLLARIFSSATMMSAFLKGEERIIIEAKGDGPIKRVYGEALQVGETRGFVEFADDASEKPIVNIADALGNGVLKISKILFNKPEAVTGTVELVKGDIATDLANYFTSSEQIPTAVILDVDFDDNGLIKQSGGIMVQALPGASEEKILEVYSSLQKIDSLTKYYNDDLNAKDLLKEVLNFPHKEVNSAIVDFFCRCTKEGFMGKLLTLGSEEISQMQKEAHNELVCVYCNNKYELGTEDFDILIAEAQAKEN